MLPAGSVATAVITFCPCTNGMLAAENVRLLTVAAIPFTTTLTCCALIVPGTCSFTLPATVVVDCSHGNSNKDPSLQPLVAENCITQIADGNRSIVGLMLESHLKAGNQSIPKDLSKLEYGMSITDPCIDWQTTENLLLKLHQSLQSVRR